MRIAECRMRNINLLLRIQHSEFRIRLEDDRLLDDLNDIVWFVDQLTDF